MLFDLKIPPGVYRNGTGYQSKGRWEDADLVRWFEGTMQPIGGWKSIKGNEPRVTLQVVGSARGMNAWASNAAQRYAAIGTHSKLYALTNDGTKNLLKDITPAGLVAGFADTQANGSYGGGGYGFDAYGTERTEVDIRIRATTWGLDNFGEFLVAVSEADGRLFSWNLMAPTASPVAASAGTIPINNKSVVVTDERFVFLLQAGGNPRRIAWGDQESLTNWQVTATTQAGDFELNTAGRILCAKKAKGELIILTSEDAHKATYIGPPLVYGFERVGTGCGVISPNAAVGIDNSVMWMGENSFFIYDGFVKPIPCDVSDHVFTRLNTTQAQKIWATYNSAFGEVTWFYPSGTEVDSYVTYNIRENHWAIGSMIRTIGIDDSVFPKPTRIGSDGRIYEHESGFMYDGQIAYAESGPQEISNGPNVMMAKYLYPDERTQGEVKALFKTRLYPNAAAQMFGPYDMANPTSIRFTGRQIAMRIEGVAGKDWRVGVPRLDVEPGGLR